MFCWKSFFKISIKKNTTILIFIICWSFLSRFCHGHMLIMVELLVFYKDKYISFKLVLNLLGIKNKQTLQIVYFNISFEQHLLKLKAYICDWLSNSLVVWWSHVINAPYSTVVFTGCVGGSNHHHVCPLVDIINNQEFTPPEEHNPPSGTFVDVDACCCS